MIRRPPRSTPLYSSAASDVYKRQGHVRSKQEPLQLISRHSGTLCQHLLKYQEQTYRQELMEYLFCRPFFVMPENRNNMNTSTGNFMNRTVRLQFSLETGKE